MLRRVYLACLAIGIPVWWALLHLSTPFRSFFASETGWPSLRWFLPFDLLMALLLTAAALQPARRGMVEAAVLAWLGMTFATVIWTVQSASPWLGAILMAVALGGLISVRTVVLPSVTSGQP